jgi:hypothetical protein
MAEGPLHGRGYLTSVLYVPSTRQVDLRARFVRGTQ